MAGPEAIFADKVRAHDTRALSTSWALFNDASVADIIKAAYWSNSNTFVACYLKDVVSQEGTFGKAALATSGPPGVLSSAQLFTSIIRLGNVFYMYFYLFIITVHPLFDFFCATQHQ